MRAEWRYLLWAAVLIRLAAVWSLPAPVSLAGGAQMGWQALNGAITSAKGSAPDLTLSESLDEESSNEVLVPLFTTRIAQDKPNTPWRVAALIWIAGAVLTFGFFVVRGLNFKRQVLRRRVTIDADTARLFDACVRAAHVRGEVTLIASPDVPCPALLGVLRPRVLVPSDLIKPERREHLRYVFLHELAHAKRNDIVFAWVLHALVAVHWFNPILWWSTRRIAADRELACDALVLAMIAPEEQGNYGNALLDELQTARAMRWSPAAASILEGKTNIEKRIALIAEFRRTTRSSRALSAAVFAALCLVAITGAKETNAGLSIPPNGIFAFAAPDGKSMLAVTIDNAEAEERVAAVTFYDGDPGQDGKRIGMGELAVPARSHATQTIMWETSPGTYAIYATVASVKGSLTKSMQQQTITCEEVNGSKRFRHAENNENPAQDQRPSVRLLVWGYEAPVHQWRINGATKNLDKDTTYRARIRIGLPTAIEVGVTAQVDASGYFEFWFPDDGAEKGKQSPGRAFFNEPTTTIDIIELDGRIVASCQIPGAGNVGDWMKKPVKVAQ
jgi:beta-lactamase regulating signal transducer with metallopeptidase domain